MVGRTTLRTQGSPSRQFRDHLSLARPDYLGHHRPFLVALHPSPSQSRLEIKTTAQPLSLWPQNSEVSSKISTWMRWGWDCKQLTVTNRNDLGTLILCMIQYFHEFATTRMVYDFYDAKIYVLTVTQRSVHPSLVENERWLLATSEICTLNLVHQQDRSENRIYCRNVYAYMNVQRKFHVQHAMSRVFLICASRLLWNSRCILISSTALDRALPCLGVTDESDNQLVCSDMFKISTKTYANAFAFRFR